MVKIGRIALIALAVLGLSTTAFASEPENQGTLGENCTWVLDEETGKLTISGTGSMGEHTSKSDIPWNEKRSSIKSVEIASGITDIANYAFQSCGNLETVTIPSGITKIGNNSFQYCNKMSSELDLGDVTEIGESAFYNCNQMPSPVLTKVSSIGESAFRDCDAMVSISLPETTVLENNVFYDCDELTTISFPKAEKIGEASFYGCDKLNSVNLPDSLEKIGSRAFYACSSLSLSLAFPEKLTEIGEQAFFNCSGIDSVTFPSSIEKIGSGAFRNCTGLTEVKFPYLERVESGIFDGCSSITKMTIGYGYTELPAVCNGLTALETVVFENGPSGEEADFTSISNYAFQNCSALEAIKLPASIETIGYNAFKSCSSLKNINLPKNLKELKDDAFYECTALESVELPKEITTLGDSVFAGCTNLTSINLSDTALKKIGQRCFNNCSSLSRAIMPETIEEIGHSAFSGCTGITKVELGSRISKLGPYAFSDCAITEIKIPRSLYEVGSSPFKNCSNLVSVKFEKKTREIPSNLFSDCEALCKVEIPSTVVAIGNNAFNNCVSLNKVDIPDGVYSIGDRAFYGCTGIKEITLPSDMYNIGISAFQGCSELKKVELGNSLEEIPNYCFSGTAIEEVVCPYTVSRIGYNAFANNSQLKKITISGYTSKIENSAFDQDASELTICSAEGSVAQEYASEKGYAFEAGQTTTNLELSESGTKKIAVGRTLYINATYAPADSLDGIKWTTSDETIATVTTDDSVPCEATVKGISAGEVTITATMGNCSQSIKVTVEEAVTDISFYNRYITLESIGDTETINFVVNPYTDVVPNLIWECEDPSIIDVEPDETYYRVKITAKKAGKTRLNVRDSKGYASAYCIVKVINKQTATGISFDRQELLITRTDVPRTLKLLTEPEGATLDHVYWESSDASVATVNSLGQVTGVSDGDAVITAYIYVDGEKVEATCNVKVQLVDVPVTGITISENKITFERLNDSVTLNAEVYPADADIKTIIWRSDNTDIATVDSNGKVTAKGIGTAVISAETLDGGFIAECKVTVSLPIQTISFDKERLLLDVGEEAVVNLSTYPVIDDLSVVNIYSSDEKVASVTTGISNNTIKGLSDGISYIRCRATDGSNVYASCKVYVGSARSEVEPQETPEEDKNTVSAPQIEEVLAKGQKIEVSKYFTTGNIGKYTVNNKKIASVSRKGLLKGKSSGEVTVEAYVKNGKTWEKKESHLFKVEEPRLSNMTFTKIGEVADINTYLTGISELRPSMYESKKPEVAQIDKEGKITIKSAGTTKITVYFGSGKNARKLKAKLTVKN